MICHALTGSQAAVGTETDPGWWSELVGRSKPIDTEKYQTVTFNVLAGCNGTTGPASVNPRTGRQYRTDFPFVTVRDIVTVHYLALKKMGINHLFAAIGGSLGGMQVLELSLMYPDFIDTCICLAATPASSDFSIAFNQTARKAIMDDPNWLGGGYAMLRTAACSRPQHGPDARHADVSDGRVVF
ncbi:alpha/beta fold hydrolase [Terrilactibacillus sp. S3-3]|nr:alpha/beta fold hydrolase [Terrilactibacillus sp. S3-3]